MGLLEETKIIFEFALRDESGAETLNWHVGEDIKSVKPNAILLTEYPLVIDFQRSLRGRQRWSLRIVNEVENQRRIAPVAECIEAPKAADGSIEHALATLTLDVVSQVARH
jgi:hypothetical protein